MLIRSSFSILVNLLPTSRLLRLSLLLLFCTAACGSDDERETKLSPAGGTCHEGLSTECEAGLACETRDNGQEYVCAEPLLVVGTLQDALNDEPVEGALVLLLDATGSPVAQALTDVEGRYEMSAPAPRQADGSIPDDAAWTVSASAQGYQPFPYGSRTAVPISANQLEEHEGHLMLSADNTSIVLLPLADAGKLVKLSGTSSTEAAGALVVAESDAIPAPFGMVGPGGSFTVFNVPKGSVTLRGYRQGFAFAPKSIDADADIEDIELGATDEGLGSVAGSVNIVNAPGGSLTSVVLVPESVFDPIAEKGPVPFGLRAPGAPKKPNISGSFELSNVSPGTYVVLAAFENDNLVRDPDTSIGGTELQSVEVDGSEVALDQSFKVTEHIAVEFPGQDGVEEVSLPLEFKWADDSSEDHYHFILRSALGDLIWEQPAVPSVSGEDLVTLPYDGPELTPGMFYQFQVMSVRESKGDATPISRTEDLRGAFRVR